MHHMKTVKSGLIAKNLLEQFCHPLCTETDHCAVWPLLIRGWRLLEVFNILFKIFGSLTSIRGRTSLRSYGAYSQTRKITENQAKSHKLSLQATDKKALATKTAKISAKKD